MSKTVLNFIIMVLVIAVLACLFYFPHRFLQEVRRVVDRNTNEAIDAIDQKRFEDALEALTELMDYYDSVKTRLEMFLNHKDINDLHTAIKTARKLASIEEDVQIYIELETILSLSEYLSRVEDFNIYNLI